MDQQANNTSAIATLAVMAIVLSLLLTLAPAYTIPAFFLFAITVFIYVHRDQPRRTVSNGPKG